MALYMGYIGNIYRLYRDHIGVITATLSGLILQMYKRDPGLDSVEGGGWKVGD